MVSQAYIMVNWFKHYGKRICSLVCVIRAVCVCVVLRVIFIWSNFEPCFFPIYRYTQQFIFFHYLVTLLMSIHDE